MEKGCSRGMVVLEEAADNYFFLLFYRGKERARVITMAVGNCIFARFLRTNPLLRKRNRLLVSISSYY